MVSDSRNRQTGNSPVRTSALRRMARAGFGLVLAAVVLGVPPTQASAQAICRPIDGSSGALFGAFSNQIFSIDVRTGKATLVTTSPFVGAVDGLNSLASNPTNLLVYYASNASASSNRAVYAFDIAAGTHFTVDADVTNNGVTVGPRGLGTGAGGYDGGSLYLGVEEYNGIRDRIYQVTLAGDGRSVVGSSVFTTVPFTSHDWGDLVVDGTSTRLYSFDATGWFDAYNMGGTLLGSRRFNTPSQAGRDALGQIWNVRNTIQAVDPSTGTSLGVALTITTDGSTALGAASDAAACVPAVGSIGDLIWNDLDTNGSRDAGEPGLAGVSVALYDDVDGDGTIDAGTDVLLAVDTTDASGNYLFQSLLPGDYVVDVTDVDGVAAAAVLVASGESGPEPRGVALGLAETRADVDFAYAFSGATDLEVVKTGPASAFALDTITYQVQVVNRGPEVASDVVVTDTLPASGTFVSASGGGSESGGVITWPTTASMAVNDTVTYSVVFVAPTSGPITNVAAATTTTLDSSLGNNRSQVVTALTTPDIVTQVHYAWSTDTPSFSSLGDDVPLAFLPNTTYILALQITLTAGRSTGDWTLQVREDGAGPWLDVLAGTAGQSQDWETFNGHTYSRNNGAIVPTSQFGVLTSPAGFSPVDGEFSNDNNSLTDGYSGSYVYTELQYAIQSQAGTAGHTYEFRVVYDGALLEGYDRYARAGSVGVDVSPDGTETIDVLPSNGTPSSYTFSLLNNSVSAESFDLLAAPGSPSTILTVDSVTGPGVSGSPSRPDSARASGVGPGSTVPVSVWFTVADVSAGTLDSLYLTGRSVSDPGTTDEGWVFLRVVRPAITNGKSVAPGGSVSPGTDLTYTLTVTNAGTAPAVDTEVLDSIPSELEFQVGSVAETLPAGVTVAVEYSDDHGSTWTYVPATGGCSAPAGYDRCVTRIRWRFTAPLGFQPPDNVARFDYVARVR